MDVGNKFIPGENCTLKHSFSLAPKKDSVKIRFPSRISMDVIDRNRLSRDVPGGGGYGFGIDVNNIINIFISDEDCFKVDKNHAPVAKHFVHIMKNIFGYDGCLAITIDMEICVQPHMGLGSSVMLSSAVVWAMNCLFGCPLSKDMCIGIVLDNYCEGYEDKYLIKKPSLGVGTHIAFYGGFVICTDKAQCVFREEMPVDYKTILIDNGSRRTRGIDAELRSYHKELDTFFSRHKAYIILMDIIPAIKDKDWKRFGKYIYEFLYAGPAQCFLQAYEDRGSKIISDIECYLLSGAVISGISSLGPFTYAVTSDVDLIKNVCDERSYAFYEFSFNNTGMVEI
jgi:predicted sugar kinase